MFPTFFFPPWIYQSIWKEELALSVLMVPQVGRRRFEPLWWVIEDPLVKKGPCYLDTILEAIEPNGSNDQRQWAMVVSVANQGNHAGRWTTECSLVLGRIETIRSWYDNERLASLDEWDFNWRSFFGRQVAGGPCLEGDGRRLSAWSSEVRR